MEYSDSVTKELALVACELRDTCILDYCKEEILPVNPAPDNVR